MKAGILCKGAKINWVSILTPSGRRKYMPLMGVALMGVALMGVALRWVALMGVRGEISVKPMSI